MSVFSLSLILYEIDKSSKYIVIVTVFVVDNNMI